MEREYSSQSISSREVSEIRSSHYESGFYITSFAATIFIGSLATVGFLLITLLITLTVMLQSCESKSSGVVGQSKPFEDYNKCKIFALHTELNNLEPSDLPSVCNDLAIWEIREGLYERDLNLSLAMVESYFSRFIPLNDGLDVVLIDVDGILPSNHHSNSLYRYEYSVNIGSAQEMKNLMTKYILRLYIKLQTCGWPMILISRKPAKLRNTTVEYLFSIGLRSWSSLIMRLGEEMQMDSRDYLFRQRAELQKQGFRITGIISNQIDATTGSLLGHRVFKLPNPLFYNSEHHIASTNVKK